MLLAQAVSLRNSVRKLVNCRNPLQDDIDVLFLKTKYINGIGNYQYWCKRPPWKQPKYNQDRNFYYSIAEAENHSALYIMGWSWTIFTIVPKRSCMTVITLNPQKPFIKTVPRHTLSKLFWLQTGHGALKNNFKWGVLLRDHYCECSKLETVEHVLKECLLHTIGRSYLWKVSQKLI